MDESAVIASFEQRFARSPSILVRAPGRVSLLGGHVDYSEGWVIPAAIDRAVRLAAAPAAGTTTTIHALDLDRTVRLDLADLPPPVADRPDGAMAWSDYPAGVAWALRAAGHRPAALDVAFGGDLPIAAGMSSSAAVEVAFLLAWEAASDGGFDLDGVARARLGERVENRYLGIASGVMDQFASLHGGVLLLDCRDLAFRRLPLPADVGLLVADTGVRRRLGEIDYGDRRRECGEAVAVLRRRLPAIRTLRDVSTRDLERHGSELPPALRRRAHHAVEECRRVRDGAAALERGDLAGFGERMRASHRSSRDLYEVTIPELDVLADAAWAAGGCYGARLSGAGFGGCVVALVESPEAGAVAGAMDTAFERRFGRRPEIFSCAVADGARILEGGR